MIRSFVNAFAYLMFAAATVATVIGLAGIVTVSMARAQENRLGLLVGDKVRVTVYGEAELSGEFELDGNGAISMPLIGAVKALSLDARALEERIALVLGDGYLTDPRISVEVLSLRPIYILGEVNNPGSYPYRAGLSILNAAAMAGGFTYRADEDDIEVTRGGTGRPVVMAPESQVRPGDIIRVNERFF